MAFSTLPQIANVRFVPASYYEMLIDVVAERGVTPEQFLSGSKLTVERIRNEDALLSIAEVQWVCERALKFGSAQELGYALGSRLQLPSHGVLGLAAMTAPTLWDAACVGEKYFALLSPLYAMKAVHLEDEQMIGCYVTPAYELQQETRELHLTAILSSFYVVIRFFFNNKLPDNVCVQLPLKPTKFIQGLITHSGAKVEVESEVMVFRCPERYKHYPLPLADAKVHERALQNLERMRTNLQTPAHTASQVRSALLQNGTPFPNLEDVAMQLGASSRTLRRQLAQEGTSFRRIHNGLVFETANTWLKIGTRSITEIAMALGYADSANFTRAFRRAQGITPSEYQARMHSKRSV